MMMKSAAVSRKVEHCKEAQSDDDSFIVKWLRSLKVKKLSELELILFGKNLPSSLKLNHSCVFSRICNDFGKPQHWMEYCLTHGINAVCLICSSPLLDSFAFVCVWGKCHLHFLSQEASLALSALH